MIITNSWNPLFISFHWYPTGHIDNITLKGYKTPMAIFMDKPRNDGWAHLFSDKPGEEGSNELHAFAEKIGLRGRWVHAAYSYAEHYDIKEGYIKIAKSAGAIIVDRRKLGRILKRKKLIMGPRRRRMGAKTRQATLQERP